MSLNLVLRIIAFFQASSNLLNGEIFILTTQSFCVGLIFPTTLNTGDLITYLLTEFHSFVQNYNLNFISFILNDP